MYVKVKAHGSKVAYLCIFCGLQGLQKWINVLKYTTSPTMHIIYFIYNQYNGIPPVFPPKVYKI